MAAATDLFKVRLPIGPPSVRDARAAKGHTSLGRIRPSDRTTLSARVAGTGHWRRSAGESGAGRERTRVGQRPEGGRKMFRRSTRLIVALAATTVIGVASAPAQAST